MPVSLWRRLVDAVSCLASLGVGCLVLARLLGGGEPWPLPKIAPFALLALPVGVATAVLALVARRWIALGLALLVLTPLLVWEAPVMWPGGESVPRGAHRLTVMTFNTRVGLADSAAVLAAVAAHRVDILVLTECDRASIEALKAGGLTSQLPYAQPADASAAVQIWSRWTMRRLPGVQGTGDLTPRAVVSTPWGGLTVTGLHALSPGDDRTAGWLRDLGLVGASARDVTGWQIVAGDFNASTDHRAFRELLDSADLLDATSESGIGHGWPAFTWPADNRFLPPLVSIDHVLVRGGVGVLGVSTTAVRGSDHRALVASLTVGR